jgi:hypothetical protein
MFGDDFGDDPWLDSDAVFVVKAILIATRGRSPFGFVLTAGG